jgi:signal transduction histidine kinase
MFNSIFARLFITCVLVILIALLLAVTLSAYLIRSEYLDNISEGMEELSDELNVSYLSSGASSVSNIGFLNANLRVANREELVIVLFDKYDDIWWFAPKDFSEHVVIDPGDRNFNAMRTSALSGDKISKIIPQGSLMNVPVVGYSSPIIDNNGEVRGAITMYKKLGELEVLFDSINKQFIISAILSFAVAFILIWAIARSITKPINKLTASVKTISKGDFSTRVEYKGEDEISYLANSFNEMARDLEIHEAMRNSFVGNVSHELRTPLTSINGFIQGIIDGTVPQEEREKYLDIVLSETKRLNALITDLMELSKVESGKFPLRLTAFDINELLRITLLSFEKRIDALNLDIEIDFEADNIYVAADKDKITQVVTNLIDNAIKFNKEKGKLGLQVNLKKNKVFIKITNTGIPISESDRGLIFERFYKADHSHARKIPGTGIGLSLVKKILAQHGEKIWIESTENNTTFAFTLESAKNLK